MVDEGLRDIAPGRGRTTDEQIDKEKQHHSYERVCIGGGRVEGACGCMGE